MPKNHFSKSGYYNVYYNNSFGKMMIIYEIPKINVLLEVGDSGSGSGKPISAGLVVGIVIAVLVVVGVVAFIIIRYKRKNSNGPSSSEKVELTLEDRLK